MSAVRTHASVRWLVPVLVLGLILAGAAFRSVRASAALDLPRLSAQQLLVKVATTKVRSLSGTVAVTTDLGLPGLPGGTDTSAQSLLTSGTHTLRVYADGPDRQRVDLLGSAAETDAVHNGQQLWQWSSSTQTATRTTLPPQTADRTMHADAATATPQVLADQLLARVGHGTSITVGTARRIAGRSAYDLRLTPQASTSTIGHADLYVDAATGLPLCVAVTARHATGAALDVRYTQLSLSRPAASIFAFTPPPGATVKQSTHPDTARASGHSPVARAHGRLSGSASAGSASAGSVPSASGTRTLGTGWTSVLEVHGVGALAAGPVPTGAASSARGRKPTTVVGPSAVTALLGAAQSVHGAFGAGRLLSTRLVSVLLTTDGRLFVGAVTPTALLHAAASAGTR